MTARSLFLGVMLFFVASACVKKRHSGADLTSGGGPLISQVKVPYNYDNQNGLFFSLEYADWKGTDDSLPAVLYIPSHPYLWDYEAARHDIPAKFRVITFTPRGFGHSSVAAADLIMEEFFTSANIAKDALTVLANTGVQKFIIYGAHYGSGIATIAAQFADGSNAPGLPQMISLILDTGMGRAYTSREERFTSYITAWNNLRDKLPKETTQKFLAGQLPGIAKDDLGFFVENTLFLWPASALQLLNGVRGHALETRAKKLEQLQDRRVTTLLCREFFDSWYPANLTFDSEGNLVISAPNGQVNVCAGEKALFDAKNFTIKSPIYYFWDTNSVRFPRWQMEYHRDQVQGGGSKSFFAVRGDDQGSTVMPLLKCQEAIWGQIAKGEKIEVGKECLQ